METQSLIPNYNNPISQGITFTAPQNGFVSFIQQPGSYYGDDLININNREVWRFSGSSSNSSSAIVLPMAQGDTFLYSHVSGNFVVRSITFYPAKS